MFYGLKIEKLPSGRFEGSCRDMPECVYEGDSIQEVWDESTKMMPAALELFYRQKRKSMPLPTPLEDGEVAIRVPIKVQAKILLWNYMIENRYRVADIARLLSISQTQAQRYVDVTKDRASVEAIEDAADALGMSFDLMMRSRPSSVKP